MRRYANADVSMMKWMMDACNSCMMHPIIAVCIDQSIENRVHPLPATDNSWVVELHLDWGQLSDQNPSFSQMGSLNMFLEVKKHNNRAKSNRDYRNIKMMA
ncbi:hypothetical protein POM88_053976 [Heracleum sosnowskyi]|uniref:Uncharacterized protein n=1 Tax=Heracleum sosnowskyi TaxID=360622 RepID=A0AAD8GPH4_9APIA|nr:hypothetical protein POM88_053976 [Heracleum sosnowskyi]